MPRYLNENPPMRRKRCPGHHDHAYVTLSGRRIMLGPWNSKEAKRRYDLEISQWLARGRMAAPPPEDALVVECVALYTKHCEDYFRDSPRSLERVKLALAPVVNMYGRKAASEFGPSHLRAVRETMINNKLCLTTINTRIGIIKQMLRYCASVEVIPAEVWHKALTLENLKPGRTAAKQPRVVGPAPLADIEAVKPHVTASVRGLIELQLLTGARSGEICTLRSCDIDMIGAVWIVKVARHKNAWRSKTRTLYIGPKGQHVLKPFILARRPGEYLFQPEDYYRERSEAGTVHRRPNQKKNTPKTERKITDHYTASTYRRAVERGCKAADVPVWHPHQLRHTCASEMVKKYGIESTRALLGHSHLDATQLYAEMDEAVVLKIAAAAG